jgi:hypothetical protein
VIDPQVHPEAVDAGLDRDGDAGLPRAWRTIKDHDLARAVQLLNGSPRGLAMTSLPLYKYRLSTPPTGRPESELTASDRSASTCRDGRASVRRTLFAADPDAARPCRTL